VVVVSPLGIWRRGVLVESLAIRTITLVQPGQGTARLAWIRQVGGVRHGDYYVVLAAFVDAACRNGDSDAFSHLARSTPLRARAVCAM